MIKNHDFQDKFGRVFHMISSSLILYERNDGGDTFFIPKETTDEELEKLMEKSVKDDKDYVYELCKENVYEDEEGVLY